MSPRQEPEHPGTQGMPAALEDVRVLDLTWAGPGPFCATLLGDLGADIIKIHEPDAARRGGPMSFAFLDPDVFPGLRNCRTIGLNLKTEEGLGVFRTLAAKADVVMEGFRPGVTERLGIDYAAMKAVNPRLVYASVTGYGQDGPYRNVAGHDINYISIGGLLGITGQQGGVPVIPGVPIADFAAGGMTAALAIVAALRQRERTGEGQYIDVAMADGVAGLMSVWVNPYLAAGITFERGNMWLSGQWPWYNVYETKDGKYVSVGALEPWFYANLCRLLGREDLIEHQFADGQKRDEVFESFRQTFLTRTRDEWMEQLYDKDTCVAPVYSVDELTSDPQLIARGMIAEMNHPTLGRVKQVGSPLKMSGSPFKVRHWSTGFGQHTEEILLEAGYDSDGIGSLRHAGIVE